MNARNLACWAAVLVAVVLLLIWGNLEPITVARGSRSAWAKLWKRAEILPIPGQKPQKASRKRIPPAAPILPETREVAERMVRSSGAVDCAGELIPRLQRSIRVSPLLLDDVDELAKGASRFAAVPDVPPGFEWPQQQGRPLDLIAQVQLSDVAPLDEDEALPNTGWLCFFYALGQRPVPAGTHPNDRTAWQVVYFDGDPGALERRRAPEPLKEEFPPCGIRFWKEWTLPSLLEEPRLLERGRCGRFYYQDLREALSGRPEENGWHHLLGHADNVSGAMRPVCQMAANGVPASRDTDPNDPEVQALVSGAERWVLLFQVELSALEQIEAPTERLPWAIFTPPDRLYYWIREEDLSAGDFSRVWLVRQGFKGEGEEELEDEEEEAEAGEPGIKLGPAE